VGAASLAAASYPKTRLADIVLDGALSERLNKVIHEYRQTDRLRAHALNNPENSSLNP